MNQNICVESSTSRNGFVCQYRFEDGSSQLIFLHIMNNSGGFGINPSLSFKAEEYVQLLCSCKGFLLLSSVGDPDVKYHVFNPISKQLLTLPRPEITRHVIRSGLASDGIHHQVVLVHVDVDSVGGVGGLEMEIFSSETGIWRRYHPAHLSLVHLPKYEFSELQTPPVFFNGSLHWEISGHLLVYGVNSGLCELIELPNFSQHSMIYKRCLSESQGRLYYTYSDFNGVQNWILLNQHDHGSVLNCYAYDRKKYRWALKHSVDHHEAYLYLLKEPYEASPLGFCADSETMYLQIPGSVVSYNIITKVIKEACTCNFPDENFNCCLFLPFANDGSTMHQDIAGELLVGVVELPIKQKLHDPFIPKYNFLAR